MGSLVNGKFLLAYACCDVANWYGVKRIELYFSQLWELGKNIWGTSLLAQVLLISSIKPILCSISLAQKLLEIGNEKVTDWRSVDNNSIAL